MLPLSEKWYEAVAGRHSVRSYTGEPLAEAVMTRLETVAATYSSPAARALILTEAAGSVFRGAVGSYGKILDPPAYVALIGNTSDPTFREACGYLGEAIALDAVSQGLGTCWVGGFFRPEVVARVVDLLPDDEVPAVIAIGYDSSSRHFSDRLIKKIARSRSRKELGELCAGLPRDKWPGWMKTALSAARLAPSAVNRQPWRFTVAAEAVTVSVDSLKDTYRIPKRLDCGIAMLNLEVGAGHAGVEGEWEPLRPPGVARFSVR